MIQFNPAGHFPLISASAYVHPSATVIGNVQIGARVFVGPNAVVRSDEVGPDGNVKLITIEPEVNIQDGVVIHSLGGMGVRIGKGTSLAHGAVVHGPCAVGENCFIGFNSVVFNSFLGDGVIILHQALIENVIIPIGMHVPSMVAVRAETELRKLIPANSELIEFAARIRRTNIQLTEAYRNECNGKQECAANSVGNCDFTPVRSRAES